MYILLKTEWETNGSECKNGRIFHWQMQTFSSKNCRALVESMAKRMLTRKRRQKCYNDSLVRYNEEIRERYFSKLQTVKGFSSKLYNSTAMLLLCKKSRVANLKSNRIAIWTCIEISRYVVDWKPNYWIHCNCCENRRARALNSYQGENQDLIIETIFLDFIWQI